MIKILLSRISYSDGKMIQNYQVPVTVETISWSTNWKGRAGTLNVEIIDDEVVNCELGDIVELFEITDTEEIKHLKYRVFDIRKKPQLLELICFDQLYYLIKSKESIILSPPSPNLIKDMKSMLVHTRIGNEINSASWSRQIYQLEKRLQSGSDSDLEVKHYQSCVFGEAGIYASDVIIQFCKKYNLAVEEIDYTDYFVPGNTARITDSESPLDIIQYYIDLTTLKLNQIYTLYDGAYGICYKRLDKRRTYILFTEEDMGDYEIRQTLPEEYYNWIDFHIEKKDTDQNKSMKLIRRLTFKNTINKYGVFYNSEDIQESKIVAQKQVTKSIDKYALATVSTKKKTFTTLVTKNTEDVYAERKLYYTNMNQDEKFQMELKSVKGNWAIRAGSIIAIDLQTFNHNRIKTEVLVEKVTHSYKSEEDFTMDITIKGV